MSDMTVLSGQTDHDHTSVQTVKPRPGSAMADLSFKGPPRLAYLEAGRSSWPSLAHGERPASPFAPLLLCGTGRAPLHITEQHVGSICGWTSQQPRLRCKDQHHHLRRMLITFQVQPPCSMHMRPSLLALSLVPELPRQHRPMASANFARMPSLTCWQSASLQQTINAEIRNGGPELVDRVASARCWEICLRDRCSKQTACGLQHMEGLHGLQMKFPGTGHH